MAKKVAKNTKKSKKVEECKSGWAKNVIIGILTIAVVCVTTALVSTVYFMKQNALTEEQAVYLEVLPELAENVVRNLDIDAEHDEVVTMSGYGVSEDGDFYATFNYVLVEDGEAISEVRSGTVYIEWDEEHKSWGYAFSYE